MQTKICSTCNEELTVDMFYADKTKSSGYKSSCKKCILKKKSEKEKAKKQKKPKIIQNRRTKKEISVSNENGFRECKCCNNNLPIDNFYIAKNRTIYTCIKCQKNKRKMQYEEKRKEQESNIDFQTERLAQALQAFGQLRTGIRKCSECSRWRDESNFRIRASSISGVANKCNSCLKVESYEGEVSDMAFQIKKNTEERMEKIIKKTLKSKGLIK